MPDEWVNFWIAISAVGATLLGLTFATFQLSAHRWRAKPLKHLASIFTLCELGAPVVIALGCLFPGHPWRQMCALAAVVGTALLAKYRWALSKAGNLDAFDRQQRRLSWLTVAVMIALAIALFAPTDWGLKILGASLIWLLVSGAIESWIFMAPSWLKPDVAANRNSRRRSGPRIRSSRP